MGCAQQKISKKEQLNQIATQNLQTGPITMGKKIISYQIYYYHGKLSLKSIDQSTILKRRRTKELITEQSSPTKIDK
ncbi:unnamed protein product [Paramecium pentaurelia]|uniref:Uncharacterized protein n=1 Tax=Paramecium pentaurelia TaxID=43138 RepID=A0A8S1UF95_9CILI|nr:unnamed protein product [Paramecium pentaurelia]